MPKFIFTLPPYPGNANPTVTYDDPVAFRKAATLACRLLAREAGKPLYYTFVGDYSPPVECRLVSNNLGTIQAETLKRTETWTPTSGAFQSEYDK